MGSSRDYAYTFMMSRGRTRDSCVLTVNWKDGEDRKQTRNLLFKIWKLRWLKKESKWIFLYRLCEKLYHAAFYLSPDCIETPTGTMKFKLYTERKIKNLTKGFFFWNRKKLNSQWAIKQTRQKKRRKDSFLTLNSLLCMHELISTVI